MSGYAYSTQWVSFTTEVECLAKKGGGTIPTGLSKQMVADCIDHHWDLGNVTMGQLREGLDAFFYGDFRNKAVQVVEAVQYVDDELNGKSPAELEKELEADRAAARL